MKNKWYVLLGIVLSLFSILIVSPIYIDGIKEGIKTGIENSKENVDQVVLDKNDQKSEENANYVYNVINSDWINFKESNSDKWYRLYHVPNGTLSKIHTLMQLKMKTLQLFCTTLLKG